MTPPSRRAGTLLLSLLVLTGCAFSEIPTPRPRATPTPTATPSPTQIPPSPSPTPIPTPDLGAIPDFTAGELVASRINGLRVRQRPGFDAAIATGLLPLDARLEVVMGPFVVDGLGWYLVTDADPDEPQFEEGWVPPPALIRSRIWSSHLVPSRQGVHFPQLSLA